jgi:hypothetical protein
MAKQGIGWKITDSQFLLCVIGPYQETGTRAGARQGAGTAGMEEDGEETTGGEITHPLTRVAEDTAAATMGKTAARSSMSRAPLQGRLVVE